MSETIKAADAVIGKWYLVCNRPRLCIEPSTEDSFAKFWHPRYGSFFEHDDGDVIPLPNDAGYDYELPPAEPDYAELHAACGLQVGDRVRVTSKTEPNGWGAEWNSSMEEAIGKIGKITLDRESLGFRVRAFADGYPWYFPCTSLEKIEPEYRPFANAAEFEPHEGRRWRFKVDHPSTRRAPTDYEDFGHDSETWDAALHDKVFCDGSPFGVEVTQ